MNERRQECADHKQRTTTLEGKIDGNGKGLQTRVAKLEVLMWIVIVLLLGNGGLIAYTIKSLGSIAK